jgi:hypothetical protein
MSGYDEWKLAYPPVYDEPAYSRACDECSRELYPDNMGNWFCEDCDNPGAPQHDEHVKAYDRSLF